MKKHVIWTNDPWEIDEDEYFKILREENDYGDDMSDDDLREIMYDDLSINLDAERENLDVTLRDEIVVIAGLGLWNGRHDGYKLIRSGNISDCLYSDCDYNTWYVDGNGDMRCEAVHHDGRNHYLYRVWKAGISDQQKENFLAKIYRGAATRQDITRYTERLGDYIGEVYGWKFRSYAKPKKIKKNVA